MNNKFRVIKIIDDTSLIVNAGIENDVSVNDVMEIYGESEPIFDPQTKENLGKFNVVKDRLKVTKVYEKMCICESPYVSTYFASINSIFTSTQRKLDVEPTDISGNGDKTIRIGNGAKLIKKENENTKNIENSGEDNLLEFKNEE